MKKTFWPHINMNRIHKHTMNNGFNKLHPSHNSEHCTFPRCNLYLYSVDNRLEVDPFRLAFENGAAKISKRDGTSTKPEHSRNHLRTRGRHSPRMKPTFAIINNLPRHLRIFIKKFQQASNILFSTKLT